MFRLVRLVPAFFLGRLLCEAALASVEGSDVGLENKIGNLIEDFEVVNSNGLTVKLSKVADGKPLMLVPVYYECPSICGVMVQEVLGYVNKSRFVAGKDFSLAFFSFDEKENYELAAEKREAFLAEVEKQGIAVEFLTASQEVISGLMGQLGFKFVRRGKDFDHPPALYVLSKDLQVSSVFKTVLLDVESLDLALVNASEGGLGNFFDKVFLVCSSFDPQKGKYTLSVLKVVRLVGLITVVLLGGLLFVLWKSERLRF